MIETINDLKNNRMRSTASASSSVAAEHTVRLKKALGSLSASRSGLKATEPLGITLSDIQNTEKKGKWWLVGARYQPPPTSASTAATRQQEDPDAQYDSDTPGSVNLSRLARKSGMNTDVRRSIFITLVSSEDYKDGHMRVLKLHLKNKQMFEVPRVIVYCCGAEHGYNPYYSYVASTFCKGANARPMRKAFAFNLWDLFRKFEDEGDEEVVGIRKLVNVAKMFGHLVADRSLELGVLKKLDLVRLNDQAGMFVNVLVTAIFLHARKTQKKSSFDGIIKEIFARAAGGLDDSQMLGLKTFIQSEVAKAEMGMGKKEKKTITRGCTVACEGLDEAIMKGVVIDDEDDQESSD